jgi:hypothetical protein
MDEFLSTVNAEPEVNVEPQTEVQETGDIGAEVEAAEPQEPQKPVQTAEDNARFAAVRREAEAKAEQRIKEATEKARQEARDSWVAEQGYEWKGKPITTEAEYKQALQEKELEDKIRAQYSNVPEELINKLLEHDKVVKQYQTEKQTAEQKAAESKMYSDFLEAYPDVKPTDIPPEVWKEVKAGKNLTDAYVRHENKLLKAEREKFQQLQQTQQADKANAAASTGSARSNGKTGEFFTREQVSAMSRDEIQQNYNAIKESEKHWK